MDSSTINSNRINKLVQPSTCLLINNTYLLGRCLGQGSFGEVYAGTHVKTGQQVAIKMEPLDSEHQILAHEYNVYKEVYAPDCGLCQCYYFGIEDDYTVLVMDSLGPSLGQLQNRCGGKFSLKTTLMLADQMLDRLEYLHERGYVHRDLKPDNFLMGVGYHQTKVHLIDYGLAKLYRQEGHHISYKTGNSLVGTARYASVNSHLGIRLSRRDDLESLVYILIYFVKGILPWQGFKGRDKTDKYFNILKSKETTTVAKLCADLPEEFALFLTHIKSLEFVARPDYSYLRGLIRGLIQRQKIVYDLEFDWKN
jgi:serine/threonine protein kinase